MKLFTEVLPEMIRVAKLDVELALRGPFSSRQEYNSVLNRFHAVGKNVNCPHNASQILQYALDLFSLPTDLKGCIVEAGCFKGGSTAKVSIITKMLGRELVVFDSFEGLPSNAEDHEKSILGHSIEGWFRKGEFCGGLEEVKNNVARFGEIESCRFVKGWFDQSMPSFNEPIVAAYLDVDLASSTKTCIKYLYPLIVPGGILYSQDGDFPLVIDVFRDDRFWETEVGVPKPVIEGLGESKILKVRKPA